MNREIKDSGIKWVGKVPRNWKIHRFKNILQNRNLKNKPKVTDTILSLTKDRGVIPYSEKGDVGNRSKEDITKYNLAFPEDIVMNSMNVIIGSVNISKYTGAVSPVYYVFYPKNKNIDIYFYNMLFQTREFQNSLKGIGNGILEHRMRIPLNKLNNIRLPLPEYKEQLKIVDFLDKAIININNIITQTYQSIEELKKYKQSLIIEAVTKGLDSTVEMKNSGIEWIGQVPEHWVVTRPNRVTTITRGNSEFQKIDMKNTGDYIAVQYGQVYKLNVLDEKYQLYVDAKFYKGEQIVQKGDTILVSTSETIEDLGHSCFYNRKDFGLLGGEQLCLKPNKQVLFDKFLYYATTYFNLELNQYATGLKVYRFKLDDLKKINMILPPTLGEQQQIVEYLDDKVSTIDNLIKDKTKVIEELESYKKSLIYEYVTGKKEV
ncbi:restriction endonuclease subunit S [Staphylococcus cohnii]|uniref:restriction endonuclease subunit S n=1 Tax=Staphylococcus cohnii TaxID=29382 RepID=UPI002B2644B7|nr:restriction endonuclease subunit S [Staphylococcus cohnii]WQJ58277.1 restriction endonuclease subunit S [Staphylococcus cohnii]